jgi:drug/metabolite transporter (DMT)-like permease
VAVVLGLVSAFAYGASDFLAGVATRRSSVLPVVVGMHVLALAVLAPLALLVAAPDPAGFLWGLGGGVAGAVGGALLYKGLAVGRMSVVSPITGVVAAAVPVAAGIAFGERPGVPALMGIGLALVAIVLVSSAPRAETPQALGPGVGALPDLRSRPRVRRDVALAVGSGLAFGAYYVILAAGGRAGLWPLVGVQVGSLVLLLPVALATGRPLWPAGTLGAVVAAAALGVGATGAYLWAATLGLLSLVAVLSALYPAATVLLARLALGERFVAVQRLGMALAAVAVVLIAGF